MIEETFYNYKGYRWFWASVLVVAAMIVLYSFDQPIGGRNGGTTLGYWYGGIALAGILLLTFYGVRKRAYGSAAGTVKGWLASHIWIGLALLVIVPLHCGFSFGLNVHTLAYALMVLVIGSGVWGVLNYMSLSRVIESHRGGLRAGEALDEIERVSGEIDRICNGKSGAFKNLARDLDFKFQLGWRIIFRNGDVRAVDKTKAAALLTPIPDIEREDALKLIGLIDQKADLGLSVAREARIKSLLTFWLYLHVPLTIGLLVAVAIHVFSVFYFM